MTLNPPSITETDVQKPSGFLRDCEWGSNLYRIKYMFGEKTIFTLAFPALTLKTSFLNLLGADTELNLPFEKFPQKVNVVVVGSYPTDQELPYLAILNNSIRYIPKQYHRRYVTINGSFEEYLGKFTSKSRATLKKKVKKFSELSEGTIQWRSYAYDEMPEFHKSAIEVSRKTYQARLLNSGLADIGAFTEDLTNYTDAKGYVLFDKEKPIAYIYCPVVDKSLLYKNLGYDPEYDKFSVGTVLQYLVLESLFENKVHEYFDFTEGDGPHKEFFANNSARCVDLFFYKKSLRNYFVLGLHIGLTKFSKASVAILGYFGLKARIKKLLRRTS